MASSQNVSNASQPSTSSAYYSAQRTLRSNPEGVSCSVCTYAQRVCLTRPRAKIFGLVASVIFLGIGVASIHTAKPQGYILCKNVPDDLAEKMFRCDYQGNTFIWDTWGLIGVPLILCFMYSILVALYLFGVHVCDRGALARASNTPLAGDSSRESEVRNTAQRLTPPCSLIPQPITMGGDNQPINDAHPFSGAFLVVEGQTPTLVIIKSIDVTVYETNGSSQSFVVRIPPGCQLSVGRHSSSVQPHAQQNVPGNPIGHVASTQALALEPRRSVARAPDAAGDNEAETATR